MRKTSAGLLLFRRRNGEFEYLLVHPGGPFWARKDTGCWSIPKGEPRDGEDHLEAAKREVAEELGFAPHGSVMPLGTITQRSGKLVHAWALECDWDTANLKSNTTTIEWPPRSGAKLEIPEVDRAEYFSYADASAKMNPAQVELLRRLNERLSHG